MGSTEDTQDGNGSFGIYASAFNYGNNISCIWLKGGD